MNVYLDPAGYYYAAEQPRSKFDSFKPASSTDLIGTLLSVPDGQRGIHANDLDGCVTFYRNLQTTTLPQLEETITKESS